MRGSGLGFTMYIFYITLKSDLHLKDTLNFLFRKAVDVNLVVKYLWGV